MYNISHKAELLFWAKVNILGPDDCWEWTAAKQGQGYGQFHINRVASLAHKISYELCNGPIHKGMFVLHDCDNRPCVNPKHLFLGTHLDNVRDMIDKGRSLFGSKNPFSKLDDLKVLAIIDLRKKGISMVRIAEMFDVAYGTICDIVYGRSWKHLLPAP